jgi:alpha-glucosidase/oligosaccharide 4-alpha-D-glucosyltransferase
VDGKVAVFSWDQKTFQLTVELPASDAANRTVDIAL